VLTAAFCPLSQSLYCSASRVGLVGVDGCCTFRVFLLILRLRVLAGGGARTESEESTAVVCRPASQVRQANSRLNCRRC
jgi:hypothetical protein